MKSRNSKAKMVADVLESDVERRWTWDEILEAMTPGIFSVIPKQYAHEIVTNYAKNLSHVYEELDNRGKFLLRQGKGWKTSFKIATSSDKEEIEKRLVDLSKRKDSVAGRIEVRVDNLKKEKLLPKKFTVDQLTAAN